MCRAVRSCALSAVLLLGLIPASLFAAPAAVLDSTSFEGTGRSMETLLHVPAIGRYALISQGTQGARLDLVDRMAGTIASQGKESGVEASSGRIDAFLEPGDYKVRVLKPATGTVSLSARTYTTANAGRDEWDVPILRDWQTVTGELHDLELLSYWVRVDASDPMLVAEMEGRSLADAVIWKDGVWDTGLHPLARTYELEKGKPLTTLEFNTRLDPGLYLLICVGGPRRPWAQESSMDTFAVTRGGRLLGATGLMSVTLGERGVESFLVSGNASFFQIRADNNKGYLIGVAPNSSGSSRYAYRRTATIDGKSVSYRASVSGSAGGSTQWLTIQGPPGETVEVRWFPLLSVSGSGVDTLPADQRSTAFMTSILGSADGMESIDATGLRVTSSRGRDGVVVNASSPHTLALGPQQPLHRRINLLSPLSFLLEVKAAGGYTVFERTGSAAASYSFLLLDDWIAGARNVVPVEASAGRTVQLQARIYIVTLEPTEATAARPGAGILDFAILSSGATDSASVLSAAPSSPVNGFFWPRLDPERDTSRQSVLVVGRRGGIPLGGTTRTLPLDLREPAAVMVDPGAAVEVEFKNAAPVRLFSTNPAFTPETARIDGTPWAADGDVEAGTHRLAVTNATATIQWYVVGAIPSASLETFPTPRPAPLETLLPTFTEGSPIWRDYGRSELASFLLTVPRPASYRVATSGRLAMSVAIRTPLKTSLFSASQNADGRNAVVTSYLRPGTYLVQVRPLGMTQGRAGVVLERQEVRSAGTLTEGTVLRSTVPPGALLRTDVKIDAEEDYRLECLGLGRSFSYRFEDADGWPIGPPTAGGALSARLLPGTYHYISSADQVATRRLLSLQLAPSTTRTAYDPKTKLLPIELNRTYSKTWVEAEGRPEDVFTLSIPAKLHLQLYLSKGMLYRVMDASSAIAFSGAGGELGETDLAAGAWRIAVKAAEEDNLKEYRLLVTTGDLYDGGMRPLTNPPQTIPVSVAKAGTVELWSYGIQEVDALLLDSAGKTVATAEPIPDDWNFRIVSRLAPGRYTLALRAPGSAVPAAAAPPASKPPTVTPPARTSFSAVPTMSPTIAGTPVVRLSLRTGIVLGASSGSFDATRDIATEVVSTAFTPKAAGVFRFSARSDQPVSASVSRGGRTLATGLCPVFLPLTPGVAYDVQFWHSSSERHAVTLRIGPEKATDVTVTGADLAVDSRDSALNVTNANAAGFTVLAAVPEGILYSPGANEPFRRVSGEAVGTVSGSGWVVREDGSAVGKLTISPLVLGGGDARSFRVSRVPMSYGVMVPKNAVAVVRTDNAGRYVGLSASPAAGFKPGLFDWSAAAATPLLSALGLREGSFRGLLWDAAMPGQAAESRASVSSSFYPIASQKTLAMGQRLQVSVGPGSALAFALGPSHQTVKVSLETGMSAFAWTGGAPGGFLDASAEAITGQLEGWAGSIVVVNETGRAGICVVEATVSQAQAAITDASAFEAVLAGPRVLSFPVSTGKDTRLYLWGTPTAARFLRMGDGRIYTGESSATEYGTVLSFPAGEGRLEVTADGALRIWSAKEAGSMAGFVARSAQAKTAALGSGGAVLGQAPETWTFSVGRSAIVCLSADTGGITAVYTKAGGLVSAAAGERSRTLLASLGAGVYTAFTRPLKGSVQSGAIRLQVLSPETLAGDGEGASVLIGPGERALYRFQVKAEGRVGAGIKAEREDLAATLLDQAFHRLDSGGIFIRSLPVGTYYLLVESRDATVRFSPLVYGLEGTRTATPDDVIRTYTKE